MALALPVSGEVLTVILHGERGEGPLRGPFYRGADPIPEGSAFRTN